MFHYGPTIITIYINENGFYIKKQLVIIFGINRNNYTLRISGEINISFPYKSLSSLSRLFMLQEFNKFENQSGSFVFGYLSSESD